MKLPSRQFIVALAVSLGIAPVWVRAQTDPPAPEKWRADLVISSDGSDALAPLNFPNDFVDNPVTGELLVVDTWNNRILRYAAGTTPGQPAGTFLAAITEAGTAPGRFNAPLGAAVDRAGNIVVADTGNGLIRVLSPDGSQELRRVDLTALLHSASSMPGRVTLAPATADMPGTMLYPETNASGYVSDTCGYIYVVDLDNSLVAVLDADLNLVTKFHGDLDAATGIAVDRQGRVYVADPNNTRVQVFADPLLTPNAEPRILASLCDSTGCTGFPGFAYPFGLALDANGRLFVADPDTNRIAVFSSLDDGLLPVSASIGVPNTGLNGTWPAGSTPDRSDRFRPDDEPAGMILPNNLYLADLQAPTNIQVDHLGRLLVADASNMRVQRFVEPTAVADNVSTSEDTNVSGNVLTNDTDIDIPPASLTAVLVAGPTHGTLISFNANGSFVYRPNGNYNGIDTFTYKMNDGQPPSNTATVTITVTPVNDPPVAGNVAIAVTQGQSVSGQMLATDIDNLALTYSIGANPAFGTITLLNTATGAFTYKANDNAPLADSFTVTVSDGLATSTATVSVTINPSNASPVCGVAFADQATLWPANHKFVPIGIKGVTDPDHDAITIVVTKIWQDESMADGSGDTPIDGQIVNNAAQVRAERSGEGDGRVYQIFFKATDAKGAACTGSVLVGVPHDQGGGPAIDSGVRYDSLVANGPIVAGTPPTRAPVAKPTPPRR
jgi:VCBS repeat-containing protein